MKDPTRDLKGELNILEYSDAEIVIGLVYPVGTDYSGVQLTLENYLKRFRYKPNTVSLSEYIKKVVDRLSLPDIQLQEDTEYNRVSSYMTAGNKLRKYSRSSDFVVAAAVAGLSQQRFKDGERKLPSPRSATIFRSLKRPEEVALLRKIYGLGFFLIGIFSSEDERKKYLTRDKNLSTEETNELMTRDADEADDFGQRTRDTFQLADVFVRLSGDEYKNQLERFLDLVFGNPYHTPEPDEHAMFLAYSASLRSAQLARQVGAAIRSSHGDILAVGCNDVPQAGGGLYWPGPRDKRDHVLRTDSNDQQLRLIIADILTRLKIPDVELINPSELFKGSSLLDVSEFGRAVHAEMDALTTCARNGTSVRGADLFTTTFPCHTCTRHIIASGIRRLVYIEPYPKSLATKLHKDAVDGTARVRRARRFTEVSKIPFEPFVGIGPRRFFDLFSMRLSRGYEIKRKFNGKVVEWVRSSASPRIQMLALSYLEREQIAAERVYSATDVLMKQGRLL
ncbi:MAG: anti-phage dCTP deaminase [Terriglobales bacterium]